MGIGWPKIAVGIIIFLSLTSISSAVAIDGENSQFLQKLLKNAPVLCDDPEILCVSNAGTNLNLIRGEMWNYSENATSWTFPISDVGIYYNLTGLAAGNLNGFTFTGETQENGGSYLTSLYSSIYKMDFDISFESNGGGLYGVSIVHDFDVETQRNCYGRRSISSAGNVESISISCLMDIDAGDNINIQIETETAPAKDIKIHTVNMNLLRVGN
jgi:hypothetical protein